jgi:hypothetical protein
MSTKQSECITHQSFSNPLTKIFIAAPVGRYEEHFEPMVHPDLDLGDQWTFWEQYEENY